MTTKTKTTKPKNNRVTVLFDDDTHAKLFAVAEKRGVYMSDVVRDAVFGVLKKK